MIRRRLDTLLTQPCGLGQIHGADGQLRFPLQAPIQVSRQLELRPGKVSELVVH
jgi:hypothetical protein